MPLLYEIDEVARRYQIAPWSIDLSDPEQMTWFRRVRLWRSMEDERNAGIRKRGGVI